MKFNTLDFSDSRYTLAFTFANLLQKDLHSFAADWNSHPIRKKRVWNLHTAVQMTYLKCQCYKVRWLFCVGVLSPFYIVGVEDQLQTFDTGLWATCMLNESRSSPTFYPDNFKVSASIILQSALGLTQGGITHDNCRNVYLPLVLLIKELVDRGITICSSFSASVYSN